MSKINMLSMSIEEMTQVFDKMNQPKFRAKQVYTMLHKGIESFDEITTLPKDVREKLEEDYSTGILKVKDIYVSTDGTKKYLFELVDGNLIETVVMKYKHGNSICISSQVGCKMGCIFCASSGVGFIRDMEAGEMLSQVISAQLYSGEKISNIVVMGIGEPFDNFDNLIKFLKVVNSKDGINIGMRHITVSTCGIVPKISELADMDMQLTLAISLHAPFEDMRSGMLPINKKYGIFKVLGICKEYAQKTGRRITFEYALIKNLNDSKECADELARITKGINCHINLIGMNDISGLDLKKPSAKVINQFKETLERNGVSVTVRRELGNDIEASCGQLRRSYINE